MATTADAKFTPVGGTQIALNIQPQSGDSYYFTRAHFGTGGASGGNAQDTVSSDTGTAGAATHGVDGDAATDRITTSVPVKSDAVALRFAYLVSSATSRQTSDYFAVGSTVEVLASTWDDSSTPQTAVTDYSNNVYREFKVTGHVTNQFNTEFAKLDVFPSAEANSQPVAADTVTTAGTIHLDDLPDYNLKITNNNGTVRSYEDTATKVTVNEVQVVVLNDGLTSAPTATFKLSYKGEMSQDMDQASTISQVAEEINGFSTLSGPVTVAEEGDAKYVVTFDAADGDVAQLVAHATVGAASVVTRENGWS